MLKIAIIGALGKMGKEVLAAIEEKSSYFKATLLIDKKETDNIKTFDFALNLKDLDCDGIIDFSSNEGTKNALELAKKFKKPLVIGTTALEKETISKAKEYSKDIPIIISSNFSIGISTIKRILPKFVELLRDYDIELIEAHHKYKKDAPSGTALTLLETIAKEYDKEVNIKRENTSFLELNIKDKKIKVHAIRSGDIIGEHEIIFANNNEVIKISHSAISRKVFAFGALKAISFLANKENGFFTMEDIV